MKRILFILVIISLAIAICEVSGHVMYLLIKDRYVWQREEFRVGGYTQPVSDERYVTAKPNYRNIGYKDNGEIPWDIEIDSHGFRVGANTVLEGGPNIVFIGDSVPFGYHVGSKDTLPSILQDLLRRQGDPRGVINAALPAYSLDQAIHRYKYELAGRYNIEVVILQIYDPASQFLVLGREWDVTKNWATFKARKEMFPFLRFSSLRLLFYYLYDAYAFGNEGFNVKDEIAISKYVGSINASLEGLRAETEGRVKKVIILPTTLPPKTWATIDEPHRVALTLLNRALRDFSGKQTYMQFVDTNELFASDKDRAAFIDDCCHLTREGATRVAEALVAHMPSPGL
jgi:hypothetical protein